jgi:hypothetical protein
MKGSLRFLPLLLPACAAAFAASGAQVLDLTVNDVGLAIGNKPSMTGLRLNFRDRDLKRLDGVNVTIWTPYEPMSGTVRGVALGLPATGADRIYGLALGVAGVGAGDEIRGITIAGIGAGAGGRISGITLTGIGLGAGGDVTGIGVGGIGIGAGGRLRGLMIGGIGVGSGGSVEGITIGGIGVGGAGDLTGISIGGIGVGSGGRVTGLSIGGIGVGSASDVAGISIAGIGVGSGGTIRGLTVAGIGVGAPRIEGLVAALAAGGVDVKGIVLAPAYFRIENGTFTGGSVSAINYIRGEQRGLTIGLFNFARTLAGVQLGLINYAGNNPPGLRVLPLVNAHLR